VKAVVFNDIGDIRLKEVPEAIAIDTIPSRLDMARAQELRQTA
jgi:hypothetical protein